MAVAGSPPQSPELFGVKLKGATRNQLQQALKAGGMKPTSVGDNAWTDTYDSSGVLQGSSEFHIGYVRKTGTFAIARYTFNGFMDTGLVTKVARMVASKYGPPSVHQGNDSLGEVTYRWNLPEGMAIRVERGWPDTTTYLNFDDPAAIAAMTAEWAVARNRAEREEAKAQSKAF